MKQLFSWKSMILGHSKTVPHHHLKIKIAPRCADTAQCVDRVVSLWCKKCNTWWWEVFSTNWNLCCGMPSCSLAGARCTVQTLIIWLWQSKIPDITSIRTLRSLDLHNLGQCSKAECVKSVSLQYYTSNQQVWLIVLLSLLQCVTNNKIFGMRYQAVAICHKNALKIGSKVKAE